jgi:hypothetical protein
MLTIKPAYGQAFFGGGAIGFEPEISTVSSGVVVDVQPTVSNDMKYVTFSARAENSQLLALHQFAFTSGVGQQGPPLGFVGTVSFAPLLPANANLNANSNANPNSNITPDDVERRAIAARSILARKGMFLLRVN